MNRSRKSRAGYGYSDDGPYPRTSDSIASDLHVLLQTAEVPSPYVFVAWSSGGLNVRLFAAQHPTDVAGLVLVDTAHEDFHNDPSPAVQKYWNGSKRRSLRRLLEATVGLNRLTGSNLAFPEVLPQGVRHYADAAGFSWQWARRCLRRIVLVICTHSLAGKALMPIFART
jgi:pimeloyl-ACP methyl ester carboxylesterase